MNLKWLPWKFIIKRAARQYGFLDPMTLLAKFRRFSQPSEVAEPIELIRAGVVFHARGLINTRVIQYNLDWVWPFWIVKQFKPNDESFIPRGFAFSHINLTHRNWTAVGHPEMPYYPIVDPRGLVTPFFDGWSIDFWLLSKNRDMLVPSETDSVRQHLNLQHHTPFIVTQSEKPGLRLETTVRVEEELNEFRTVIHARGQTEKGGWLVLSIRPYNPEGIQFVNTINLNGDGRRLEINQQDSVYLDRLPEKMLFSDYRNGDVARVLDAPEEATAVSCDIGMATAAALFPADEDNKSEVRVSLPLVDMSAIGPSRDMPQAQPSHQSWQSRLAGTARLSVPDQQMQFLYDAAVRTLMLLSADEVFPGPYTYKRFWFRDACLMINALLAIGLSGRATRHVLNFPERQLLSGYFRSQDGEWDSNGQVLWIAGRLQELTGIDYDSRFLAAIEKGAEWINKKRLNDDPSEHHTGLLPPGFSAEHLGPNDYFYWDNFWGWAGLKSAARLAGIGHSPEKQVELSRQAADFERCILESIEKIPAQRRRGGIPASPYRRMDAGAIGSLAADYPLQLLKPDDPMVMKTISYLMKHCFHSGAFFQDMIHSGINAYLTLAIAQTLLRAGDPAYKQLVQTVADLASPTGQWPEAIHPFTKGGCMGDGQHGWAAAEWLMMIRNLFVREEGNKVLIGSGIFPEWLEDGCQISFGPTLISGGKLTVTMQKSGDAVVLDIEQECRKPEMRMIADIPGYEKQEVFGSTAALKPRG